VKKPIMIPGNHGNNCYYKDGFLGTQDILTFVEVEEERKPARIATFHPAKEGTICECGWSHGSRYEPELELRHRVEHLENLAKNNEF